MPVVRKIKTRMTARRLSVIDKLHWQKITSKRATKYSSDLLLAGDYTDLDSFRTRLLHRPWGHWHQMNACLVPVEHKFRRDLFHGHYGHHVAQELLLDRSKVCWLVLALGCHGSSPNKVHAIQEMVCPVPRQSDMSTEFCQQ